MDTAAQVIPKVLIYEMVDGRPIYYKGYKEYLNGNKQIEELMGSSYLQSVIITELVILLGQVIDRKKYRLNTNEIGLKFGKKSWRAADLAIFEKEKLKHIPLDNKYLEVAPEIVIEIDTKADLEEVQNPFGYYQEKTAQLLEFGVKKVIWIFTETKKVMIAANLDDWQIKSWNMEVEILDLMVNIDQIVKKAEI